MMKLLLVTFSDNADHQDTLFGMYEALRKDAEFDVYLLAIKSTRVSLIKSDHTWLVDCPKRPGICGKTFDFLLLFKIISKIRNGRFDVIYFESLHVWNLPIMWALKNETHIFHVIHDVVPHKGDKQYTKIDIFNRILTNLSDDIVLRNKKYISEMIDMYHILPQRVKYLGLWRRFPKYTPSTYSRRILFFGRINPYKGIDRLVEIAKLCPQIQFDVVGRVDPQIQEFVQSIKAMPNIKLKTGYVSNDEMAEYFTNCDWVVIPYNSASQSGVIIDAYKYSRPVIAFEVGAIAEQVKNGASGYLIPAGNVKKFSEKLEEVVRYDCKNYDNFSKTAYALGCKQYAVMGKVDAFKRFIKENI